MKYLTKNVRALICFSGGQNMDRKLMFIGILLVIFFGTVIRSVRSINQEGSLIAIKYGLEIKGEIIGYFDLVDSNGSESEILVEPKTGVTIPGRLSWLNVTLRRGITSNLDVWEWRRLVVEGKVDEARTQASIIAYNQTNEEITRWKLENAWPMRIHGSIINEDTDYIVEEITIAHEGMLRLGADEPPYPTPPPGPEREQRPSIAEPIY